jgi:hypothetical protein
MRTVLWAAAAMAGFVAFANAAPPSAQQDVRVTHVDRAGRSFTAQTQTGNATYKTTERTVFRAGATPTSWAAVKAGSDVAVVYHLDGKSAVADEIVIGN